MLFSVLMVHFTLAGTFECFAHINYTEKHLSAKYPLQRQQGVILSCSTKTSNVNAALIESDLHYDISIDHSTAFLAAMSQELLWAIPENPILLARYIVYRKA